METTAKVCEVQRRRLGSEGFVYIIRRQSLRLPTNREGYVCLPLIREGLLSNPFFVSRLVLIKEFTRVPRF